MSADYHFDTSLMSYEEEVADVGDVVLVDVKGARVGEGFPCDEEADEGVAP